MNDCPTLHNMGRIGARRAILLGMTVPMALFWAKISDPAMAADWTVQGRISETAKYDDNYRLESSNKTGTFASVTTPQLFISTKTPNTEIEINPRLSVGLFTADSSFNYFDQYLGLRAKRLTQTGDFGINTTLSNEATLETENDDTGRYEDGHRLGVKSEPFWTHSLTERDRIRLRGAFEKVDYRSTEDLDDFTIYGGSVDYERDLTLQDEVGLTFNYRHYDNDDDSREQTDSIGLEAIWRHQPSERLSTLVAPGIRYVWSDNRRVVGGVATTDEDQQLGGTIRTAVDWQATERTDLRFLLSRGLSGSGSGNAVLRDLVSLRLRHQAWELVGFSFQGDYIRNADSTSLGFSDAERDYVRLRPAVNWTLTRDLTLSGGYQFRWQDEHDGDGDATSNMVFLELTYNTPIWHFD